MDVEDDQKREREGNFIVFILLIEQLRLLKQKQQKRVDPVENLELSQSEVGFNKSPEINNRKSNINQPQQGINIV